MSVLLLLALNGRLGRGAGDCVRCRTRDWTICPAFRNLSKMAPTPFSKDGYSKTRSLRRGMQTLPLECRTVLLKVRAGMLRRCSHHGSSTFHLRCMFRARCNFGGIKRVRMHRPCKLHRTCKQNLLRTFLDQNIPLNLFLSTAGGRSSPADTLEYHMQCLATAPRMRTSRWSTRHGQSNPFPPGT